MDDLSEATYWALQTREGNYLFHGNQNHKEGNGFPDYHVSPFLLMDSLIDGYRPVVKLRKWELADIRREWNNFIKKTERSKKRVSDYIVRVVKVVFKYEVKYVQL